MGILQKTFGGLDRAYYFRHLFFAIIFALIFCAVQYSSYTHIMDSNMTDSAKEAFKTSNYIMYAYIAISALLYPYARFVYESIVNFIMGDNVFFINILIAMIWKFFVMMFLFCFAIFIAPIGLLYLWYYHNKNQTFDE